jgi:gliding motility-associated-like protein
MAIKLTGVKFLSSLITLLLLSINCFVFGQGNSSSQGKEFWTAYMTHIEDNGFSQMSLYVTADENTTVTLEVADGSFSPIVKEVVAGQVTIIAVPKTVFLKNQGQFMKGLHITSVKKVAVFAHIYASSVSGATLLLPVAVLGKSYFSINYTQDSNAQAKGAYSTFMVIATEDNTTVEITPSQTLLDGKAAGKTFSIILKKGEVYQGLSENDLTNTSIKSVSSANGGCKKIAVFSGSSKIAIGCHDKNFTSDNLFQQVYPTVSWGKDFITIPLKSRNYDIFRVIFTDPNTVLRINGELIDKTQYRSNNLYEFESLKANTINADKPIQVVQYAVTQGKMLGNGCQFDSLDRGDPEMIYLNPLEQTLDHVTLYSSPYYAITNHFINVVIKADKASSFMLDGVPYSKFVALLSNNSSYAYAQIPVTAGTHYLSAGDGFSAIAYGFGNYESYGYSGGTNFKNLDEYVSLANPQTNSTQLSGCSGIDYRLQLVLPYQTTQVNWNFNNGAPIETFKNPKGIPFTRDGKILYLYQYPQIVNYTKGSYSLTATVVSPLSEDCGTVKDIGFDFNVDDFAVAKFSVGPDLCSAADVFIHDESAASPGSITRVQLWFDYLNHPEISEIIDKANIPTDRNFHHKYPELPTDAVYTVHMEVFTGEGSVCTNGFEKVITVKGSPVVSFDQVSPVCVNNGPIQLVADNKGFLGTGNFSGTGVSGAGVFNPAISGPGTFKITYTFIAANGCGATYTRDVVVNPLPVVNAGGDLLLLEGESVVLPARASGDGLTFAWQPTTGLSDVSILNPLSSAIDNITYQLTVTTAAGCTAVDKVFVRILKKPVIINAFTPNGDGINDTWTIKYLDTYPGNTVDIYNRQGERVYSSVGYASPWDGTYRGTALPGGTYYYIINPKNGRKIIAGNVTIIK